MKLTKPQLTPVWYWFTDALTIFANGCLSGVGAGTGTGAVTGGALAGTQLGQTLATQDKVAIAVLGFLSAMLSNGIKHFVAWHGNGHPMPNPWPKPGPEVAT